MGIDWLKHRQLWPEAPVPTRFQSGQSKGTNGSGPVFIDSYHFLYLGKVGPKGWWCKGPGFTMEFSVDADGAMHSLELCYPELEEAGWVECIRNDEAAELLDKGAVCPVPERLWGGTWYVSWNCYYAEGPGGIYLQPCHEVSVTKDDRVEYFYFPSALDKYMKDPKKRVELLPVVR